MKCKLAVFEKETVMLNFGAQEHTVGPVECGGEIVQAQFSEHYYCEKCSNVYVRLPDGELHSEI